MRTFARSHKKLIGGAAAAIATAALGVVVPQLMTTIEARVAPAPVLHAQVTTDVARFRSSSPHVPEFVIPRPLAQIGRPPDADDVDPQFPQTLAMRAAPLRYAWAHRQGGVDATEASWSRTRAWAPASARGTSRSIWTSRRRSPTT